MFTEIHSFNFSLVLTIPSSTKVPVIDFLSLFKKVLSFMQSRKFKQHVAIDLLLLFQKSSLRHTTEKVHIVIDLLLQFQDLQTARFQRSSILKHPPASSQRVFLNQPLAPRSIVYSHTQVHRLNNRPCIFSIAS